MTQTQADLKLDRRLGKIWDLDAALAYIEGGQPSSQKGGSKMRVNKSSSANIIGCSKAAKNMVTSKPMANTIPVKPVNNTGSGGKLASLKEDLNKETWFKKDVEILKNQLAAEISGRAKVDSMFQNLKIEVASLKESNSSLQEELTPEKKSQKELEQSKIFLNKEQQLRMQVEANGKLELAAMASKEQKLQVQVQSLLKAQEKLQAALALETNRRLSVEQELERAKVEKTSAISDRMSSQPGKLESQIMTVVRQLVARPPLHMRASLSDFRSVGICFLWRLQNVVYLS